MVGEFDRSEESSLRDVLIALGSELSAVRPHDPVLLLDGEPLGVDVTVRDLARRRATPEGGRIPLVLRGTGSPIDPEDLLERGSATPDKETEVMELGRIVHPEEKLRLGQKTTEIVRRPLAEYLAGGAPTGEARSPAVGQPRDEAKTEVIDRRRLARDCTSGSPATGETLPTLDPGSFETEAAVEPPIDDMGDYENEEEGDPPQEEESPSAATVVVKHRTRTRRWEAFPIAVALEGTTPRRGLKVVPRIPGCVVTPVEASLAADRPDAALEFWVTPVASGELPSPALEVHRESGETRSVVRVEIPLFVAGPGPTIAALAAAIVLPWLWTLSGLPAPWAPAVLLVGTAAWLHSRGMPRTAETRARIK
ncbi:MAG: hypothetical protein HY720_01195 [Planctomycetes bacterium]|nr:hypothetical protein [Planctomycetota bacterium]